MNILRTSEEMGLVIKDVPTKIVQIQLLQWSILKNIQKTINTHLSHKSFLKREEKGTFFQLIP